ncbi:MAG: hypothetical protein HYV18_07370 [Gammaproteobacteria bacterium]|nr:hypothetical protein [Gammaproteobacteria bacterium]
MDTAAWLSELNQRVLPMWAQQIEAARALAEDAINTLVARFAQVGALLNDLLIKLNDAQARGQMPANVGDELRREINQIVTLLQFQDRMSQILRHVTGEHERLVQTIEKVRSARQEGASMVDVETWLAQGRRGYTTAEQHGAHGAQGKGGGQAADDVELF